MRSELHDGCGFALPPAMVTTVAPKVEANTETLQSLGHHGVSRPEIDWSSFRATASNGVELRYVGFWRRLVAFAVDYVGWCVCLIFFSVWVGFLLGLVLGVLGADEAAVDAVIGANPDWAWSLEAWVVGVIYNAAFVGLSGRTPGKMLLGIRVLDEEGKVPGLGRAALRETVGKLAASLFFGIGFIMAGLDDRKQGLHDQIAMTYVVCNSDYREWQVARSAGRSPNPAQSLARVAIDASSDCEGAV